MDASVTYPEPSRESVEYSDSSSFVVRKDDYPWQRSVWNCHREIEIHLITRSHGTEFVGDHVAEFAPGRLVMAGSWLPHDWVSYRTAEWPIVCRDVVVQFDPSWAAKLSEIGPELKAVDSLVERSQRGLNFLGPSADEGRRLMLALCDAEGARRLSLMVDLLDTLARTRDYEVLSTATFANNPRDESYSKTQRAIEIMNSEYPTPLTLSAVADRLGVGSDYLGRIFRRNVGFSFSSYVVKIRVNRACHLLRTTDMKVCDIGYESGFNNTSNFNRLFLRLKGVTPREFRRSSQAP